jgi:hypothetical protein
MKKIMQGKFKLTSDLYHGEYFYNSMKEAEQKAAELGWRHYQIEIVVVEL